MNGAYQIINFDDIEFTTGTAELVVGAYKKITDTAKRFVITHLNLDDEVYKDIQLTFENVEGTFVGTGVVNGKLAVVSIASTDQVTVSLNDIAGGITSLENQVSLLSNSKANKPQLHSYNLTETVTILPNKFTDVGTATLEELGITDTNGVIFRFAGMALCANIYNNNGVLTFSLVNGADSAAYISSIAFLII